MKNLKKILFVFIILFTSIFINGKILDIIFHDYMFVVDMNNTESYRITNSYNNGVTFDLIEDDEYYITNISKEITGEELQIKLKLNEEEKRIEKVLINNIELSKNNIIKLTDYSQFEESYANIPLFIIENNSNFKTFALIFLSIIVTTIISIIFLSKNKISSFIYSASFIKLLKRWDWIILIIVFLAISFVTVGCDAKIIANVGNLFYEDIDMYQLQVNTRLITNRVYAEFPYNPLMLCIWGGILSIFRPLIKMLPIIGDYPFFEVSIIKCFNLIFIFLTLCSLLSFLLDHKIIDKKRAKWIYYLGLFNPLTFYVALLFVQLDPLTLYLMIIGTLLLSKLNENNYLGIVLISIGLLLKMQILFLLPSVVFLILYILFFCSNDKLIKKINKLVICGFIFGFFALNTFIIPYLLKTPFYHLEANFEQSERMWFTTIPYASNIFLFITLGSLAIVTILFVLNIHSKIKKENFIISTILNYAVIVFMFSFSIIPTPSIYMLSLGAIVMILALEKDKLKNFLFIIMLTLIITCPMFSDYGDISKILKNPNEPGFITEYVQKMDQKDSERFISIIFTISAVSMLTYGLYIQKKSIDLLKEGEKNV